MSLTKPQQNFVDKTILHPKIKRCISSPEEYKFKPLLKSIGKENADWFHQPAYYDEERGLVAIPDFAFPKERLIIELDGKDHRGKKKQRDIERDMVFNSNEFSVIRIPVPMSDEKMSYWRIYIKETLKILIEEADERKPKSKVKLFTNKEFEKVLKMKLKNYENT